MPGTWRKLTPKEIQDIREYCPGYIGGSEIAHKATDTEIEALIDLGDEAAVWHNRYVEASQQRAQLLKGIAGRT
jgi:hypothetical protein